MSAVKGGTISGDDGLNGKHVPAQTGLESKSLIDSFWVLRILPKRTFFNSALRYRNPRLRDRVFKMFRGKTVKYAPDVQSRVPEGLRPDLVVGLFKGHKASKILNAPARIDPRKRVGGVIKPDIFAKEGADVGHDGGMIFPFLVLEAKRPKAPDSLEDMERQMALPAYEMLRTQKRLLENSTAVPANDRLPKVWLVSFKAQIWKLYVATTERDEDDEDAYVGYLDYGQWPGSFNRVLTLAEYL